MNQQPAQTCCRIFRPWDGVGSKPVSPEPNHAIEHLTASEKLAQSVRFEQQLNRITNQLCHPYFVDPRYQMNSNQPYMGYPPVLSDTVAQDMFAYLTAPRLPYGPSNIPASMPVDAMMNSAIFNPMSQEYARILAEEAEAKNLNARKQRPKRFKCPHCDVAFSNNGQLKGHVRIHTGKLHLYNFTISFDATQPIHILSK